LASSFGAPKIVGIFLCLEVFQNHFGSLSARQQNDMDMRPNRYLLNH